MDHGRWDWIVPAGLWEIVRPLLPPLRVRPQGGGVANIDDEAVFAAIVYVLTSGCAWRHLPPCFGASKSTVHRRFMIWSRAGVWGRLHQVLLDRLDEHGLLDLAKWAGQSVEVLHRTYSQILEGFDSTWFERIEKMFDGGEGAQDGKAS